MLDRSRFEHCGFWMGWISLVAAIGLSLSLREARGNDPPERSGSGWLEHVAPGGTSVYVPNRWGIIHLSLKNPTADPLEVLATTYFEDEPTLQFGRRVWIPAKSQMQTWHPVLMPRGSDEGRERFDFRTLVMDAAQQREVLIRSDSGALQFDGLLRANERKQVVGLIDHRGDSGSTESNALFDLMMCVQSSSIPNGQSTYLTDRMLPSDEESLQSLDQLVIADRRVSGDAAGLAAIRSWLFGGGRLWVMLDRAESPVLEKLLGDEFRCQVVDRVGLTTVRLETKAPNGNVARDTTDYEQPVEFVRVIPSEVEVACTIDGWPAAFWKTCGEGRLLVTMLGSRGWFRKHIPVERGSSSGFGPLGTRPPAAAGSAEQTWQSPFVALRPMQEIAAEFFRPHSEPRLAQATLEPLVQEYVGYSIPARWQVLGLLLGFCGVIAAVGHWLWRRSRLEVLGVISPALALSVSLILVWLGWQQRQSVPAAVASVQFVRAIPGTDDIRVEGAVGLFAPDSGIATAGSKRGGRLLPDMTGLEGKTRRMVWTDLDEWHWEHLPESAGLMNGTMRQSSALTERLEARATFGPEGLSGRLWASAARDPTDAILATRSGRIGVDLRDDGTFVARSNAVFSAEQFLGAELLSDEQHRRQRVLMQLLNDPQRRDYPNEPQLLFWSKPWNLGFQYAQDRQMLGSALVAVPVTLERPPTGTEVSLTAPWLDFRETLGPDDLAPSGLWDPRRREWQEKIFPTTSWLRFQIPQVLLPVAVQRGRLMIQVAGPVVRLEVAGLRPNGQDVVPIKTWNDPVGTLSLELTDPELLTVAADGGFLLRVSAGDPKRLEQMTDPADPDARVSFWRIESLALELHVKTTEVP